MSQAVPFVLPEALEGRVLFAAAPVVYQAESASLAGPTVARNHAGYSGTGFVDYRAKSGESVEWTVRAEEAGTYLLSFRFANGGDANRPLALAVNGRTQADEVAFTPSGSWTAWNTVGRRVTLAAGTNRVRLTSLRRSGPNMDSLTVSPDGVAVPPQDVRSLRVFHVGNSVTNTIQYRNLEEMAERDGREYVWGRHMIPGAPLSYIWSHPTSGFETDYGFYREALREHEWDVLTLQPFDRQIESPDGQGDLTMTKNFINLALQKSPDLQVYIYQRWPRRQGEPGDYSLDYEAQWLRQYNPGKWDRSNETRDYFARLIEALRDEYPQSDKPVLMVPVGDVMFELARRIEDGDVPGLDSIEDLYYDGIHLNNIGSLVTATTFYATMYGRDPRGIDHTSYNVIDDSYDRVISTRTAAAIQDAVWDVVKGHEYSGVE